MRKLYILQGMPGSGKSSFIKNNKLESYTINLDQIRSMYETPTYVLDETNQLKRFISQTNHHQVIKTFYDMMFNRFKNQETTIIDATNLKERDLKEIINFSNHFMYTYKIVRIGENISFEELLYRNKKRGIYNIPKDKFLKMYETYRQALNQTSNVITANEMLDDLRVDAIDITEKYEDFQVIGDVHSSASTLKELLKNFSNKRLYIFCGDYFDRGIEHYETLLFLEKLMSHKNVIFIAGNHDVHLYNYILYSTREQLYDYQDKISITGKDFKSDTINAFYKNHVSLEQIKNFFLKLKDVFYFKFHGQNFLVSHAGLTNQQVDMRDRFNLQDSDFFIRGVGNYSYDIDKEYQAIWGENNYPIQFHGHRNAFLHDVFRRTNSLLPDSFLPMYNLEQKVERGGKIGSVLVRFDQKIIVNDVSVKTLTYNTKIPTFDNNSIPGDMQNKLAQSSYIKRENLDNNCNAFHLINVDAISSKEYNRLSINSDLVIMDESEHVILKSPAHIFEMNSSKMTQEKEIVNYFSHKIDDLYFIKELNGYDLYISYQKNLNNLLIKSNDKNKNDLIIDGFINYLNTNQYSLKDLKSFIKKEKNNHTYVFKVIFNLSDSKKVDVYLSEIINNNKLINDNEINTKYINKFLSYFNKIKYNKPIDITSTYSSISDAIEKMQNEKVYHNYVIFSKNSYKVRIKNKFYSKQLQLVHLLRQYVIALKNGHNIKDNLLKSKKIDLNVRNSFLNIINNKTELQLLSFSGFYPFMDSNIQETIKVNNLQNFFELSKKD